MCSDLAYDINIAIVRLNFLEPLSVILFSSRKITYGIIITNAITSPGQLSWSRNQKFYSALTSQEVGSTSLICQKLKLYTKGTQGTNRSSNMENLPTETPSKYLLLPTWVQNISLFIYPIIHLSPGSHMGSKYL